MAVSSIAAALRSIGWIACTSLNKWPDLKSFVVIESERTGHAAHNPAVREAHHDESHPPRLRPAQRRRQGAQTHRRHF
jgi:hypothetical protein